jgi:glucose-1-phosphate thymidylyltransferase
MHAVILCAGYATRMGALTRETTKPLPQVGGKAIVDYLVDEMIGFAGFESITIVTNDRFHSAFTEWQGERAARARPGSAAVEVLNDGTMSNETRLGALGDLRLALEHVSAPSRTLVAAGDNIFLFSLADFWRRFTASEDHWVLGLRERNPRNLRRSAVLELGAQDQVLRVHEKPADPPSEWTCPMIYCLQPSATRRLEEMLDGSPFEHGRNFIDVLCRQETVRAFKAEGQRFHVGDEQALREANELLPAREGETR